MISTKDREVIPKSVRASVDVLIKRHIDRFNNILYDTQISYDMFSFKHPKLRNKVARLTNLIENELYNLCLSNSLLKLDKHEEESDILAYINRERDGGDFSSFIKDYTKLLNNEIEAYIESSLYFDIYIHRGLKELKSNPQNAYSNDFIKKAYKEVERPSSFILRSKGMTAKRGQYKTSSANLKRLIWFVTIEALTYRQISHFNRMGATGYEVHRGSSYPCDFCDSFVGFHEITDTNSLPPQHGSCYCYITPSFKE